MVATFQKKGANPKSIFFFFSFFVWPPFVLGPRFIFVESYLAVSGSWRDLRSPGALSHEFCVLLVRECALNRDDTAQGVWGSLCPFAAFPLFPCSCSTLHPTLAHPWLSPPLNGSLQRVTFRPYATFCSNLTGPTLPSPPNVEAFRKMFFMQVASSYFLNISHHTRRNRWLAELPC